MRATGMPDWMVRMVALQAASTDGNGQTPDGDRFRDAGQLQRQLGDDAERAFRADHQPREIVAGRRTSSRGARWSSARRSAITTFSASTLSFMVP